MRALAVDFGTSNTVAALGVDGGAPRLVTIDGSPLVPSSVYLTDDGILTVGRDADRQARIDPSRYEPNPKRRIDDGALLLGTQAIPVTTVIAQVLARVASEVRRQLGGNPDQVRLTHPARWAQRRKDTLITAARQAGLADEPVLIPEPVAAATHFATLSGRGLADGQALAVYDLGGGTFDIAVVRRTGNSCEVLAEAGLPDLGGLDFDHAIIEHIGRTHAEQVDAEAWRRLLMPTDAASRRLARALATDVRDGKEALSRHPHVDIALPPPFTDVHLTRAEFEDLIRPNLSRSIDLMRRTIAQAGLEPAQLAGVYLVGGSSRIPLVARLIQEGLGVTPATLDQPETSVVTGALYLQIGQAQPAAHGRVTPLTGQTPVISPPNYPQQTPLAGQSTVNRPVGAGTGQQIVSRLTRVTPVVPGAPVSPQVGTTGSATGTQPVADRRLGQPVRITGGTNLPPIRPVSLPPTSHQATPPDGRSGPPPQPASGPSRTLVLALTGGGLVLALVIALAVVFATRGDRQQARQATNTSYDRYFADPTVRDYVRPLYPQIRSCQEGALGEAVTGTATCTFDNGVQVTVGRADDQLLPLDQIRQLIPASMQITADLSRNEGTWSGGTLDTFEGKDATASGSALYWDREKGKIWGLAVSPSMSAADLRDWWQDRFAR